MIHGVLGWLAVTFVAAAAGALASTEAAAFYAELRRPPWAPPASWFGPVWSFLYVTMAVAAALVWHGAQPGARWTPVALYLGQLVLNALWSWLFFAWRLGALAFLDVLLLFALIAATALSFWRVSRLAGALLVPYLVWVGFASVLTWAVWQANPALLK